MRLSFDHVTRYRYDAPVRGVQQSHRLTPADFAGQKVTSWTVEVAGGIRGGTFRDGAGDRMQAWSVPFRTKFADQLRNLSLDFYNAAQFEAALFFIRRALVFDQCPSYYIDLTNALARVKTPAQLRDYTREFSEADLGRHVFITCAPKSGSTFLKNLLVSITGFKFMFAVYASLQNEQELDPAASEQIR